MANNVNNGITGVIDIPGALRSRGAADGNLVGGVVAYAGDIYDVTAGKNLAALNAEFAEGIANAGSSNFSGDYGDLINKPSLAAVATSGAYSDLSGIPSLATVATSGSFNDLTNVPFNVINTQLVKALGLSGLWRVLFGYDNDVTTFNTNAFGVGLKLDYPGTAVGEYNKPTNYAEFTVGCGLSDSDRGNALVVDTHGNVYIKGINGYDGTNSLNPNTGARSINQYLTNLSAEDVSYDSSETYSNGTVGYAIQTGITSAAASASAAASSASTASGYYSDILTAMGNLGSGEAVAAQVAINQADIAGLKSDVVVDLSTRYATSYANLSAALTALNSDTAADATAIKKSGVSIKFINSSTNKYEQWNLKASSWSTNTSNWTLDADGSVTNGKLKLPFELEKPSDKGFVTQASEIGYEQGSVADKLEANLPHNSSTTDAELAFSDGNGYDAMQVKNGFVRTKNFDSQNSAQAKDTTTDAELAFSDGNGYDIFQVKDGYPMTKKFNGRSIKEELARLANNPVSPSGGDSSSDTIKSITINNSDKIGIIGDSYTESAYAIKGKSYISKLSLFSDFQFVNFGNSGDIYIGRINAIRNKNPKFGLIPFDEQGITYAMMCCYTNDIKVMNVNDYLNSLRTAIKVVKNIGITPIVCTEYQTGSGIRASQIRSGLQNVAEEFGLKYFDIASIVDLTMGSRYAPFWGGSHPGTRTNAIESDNYQKYLQSFTPMKSIKIFRGRKDNISSLDELMFSTNYERANIFKEINVGASDISNSAFVDNLDSASISTNVSEYQALMANNGTITMPKYSLISVVLPSIARDLTYLALKLTASADVDIYVKSSMEEPFVSPQSLSSFYIASADVPQIGAVYKCNEDNKNYTVVGGVLDDAGDYHLLCSPSISPSSTTGTLTKVSGTGNNSISYTFREIGYLPSDISSDLGGHWRQIDVVGGVANITSCINDCVDIDKVHFLLVSASNYQLSNVSVDYKSNVQKIIPYKRDYIFETNYYSEQEELLPSNTFGTADTVDANWGVTPINIYEKTNGANAYPRGCSSAIKVTHENKLNCTILANKLKIGNAVLEIWCRYFPDVYTNGSGNQITESSFDYNEIFVDFGGLNATLKDYANTHWKIIRFNVNITSTDNLPISIYSNENGMEIAYVSLKYKK